MPAKGTKKVIVHGQEVWLPEEQARIEELILQGLKKAAEKVLVDQELKEIKGELEAIAERRRGARATVVLQASKGRATVSWGKKTSVSAEIAEDLREKMGPSDWKRVFSLKVEYGLARTYKAFMQAAPASVMALKAKIAEAIEIRELAAQVKFDQNGGAP